MNLQLEVGKRYTDERLEVWKIVEIGNAPATFEGRTGSGILERHAYFNPDGTSRTSVIPDLVALVVEPSGPDTTVVTEPGTPVEISIAPGEKISDALRREGVKYDEQKPPLHLIAPDFLYAISEILDFGAHKYTPRNWEKGMAWHRPYRAALGHLFDWFMRKGPDPETGKSHLWHAACCIMFLVVYEMRGIGQDDRP
jgi:hypothetical protein